MAQQMHRTRRVSRLRAGTPVVEVVLGLHQGGAIPPGMTFEDLGVSAIVDLDDQAHWIPPTPLWGVYVYWPLPDGTKVHANTTRAIAHAVKNLVEAGHVVLIHCEAGLNRSCLVTARALIAMGWDPQTAISHVRACRRDARVLSNPAFVGWLQGERPGT